MILRVLYHTTFKACTANDIVYHLEHVADYYPFGKSLREYVADTAEKFLTTHHERDVETGLDYRGARFYDGEVGRFLSVDPLAADYAGWSTYNYVLGNPVRWIDSNGKEVTDPGIVVFVQLEARGSAFVTAAYAIGVMIDSKGNAGLYHTSSLGGALGYRGVGGLSFGTAIAEDIYALEGYGVNAGAFSTAAVGLTFGGEINLGIVSENFIPFVLSENFDHDQLKQEPVEILNGSCDVDSDSCENE